MEIDIREPKKDNIDTIRVCDNDSEEIIADIILKDDRFIRITDSQEDSCFVNVQNKEHALNLIKGLEKAIDLGWIK